MRRSAVGSAAVLVLMLLGAASLGAHHSFDAEYDSKQPITVTGFVTKVDWINPHAYIYIDTKDDTGAVKNYRIEMGPPYALARGGWTRTTLQIGDEITVHGAALAKDGSHGAGSMQTTFLTRANGQKLVMR
jgi:hypothetical protein